jgi:hypothetical protein
LRATRHLHLWAYASAEGGVVREDLALQSRIGGAEAI